LDARILDFVMHVILFDTVLSILSFRTISPTI
jgi:hypothetical protein